MFKKIKIVHYTNCDIISEEKLDKPLNYLKTYCVNLKLGTYDYWGFKHISNTLEISSSAMNHDIIIMATIYIDTELSNEQLLNLFGEGNHISWDVTVI